MSFPGPALPRPTLTVPGIRATKRRDGASPLVMVTAYDAPTARLAAEAGVDMLLVGDSVGTALLGY
jgi:3-methyl-2-oxobutanoate hydroxymethyltransferase